MKKLLATTVALGFTAAAAVAGPYMSSKEPVPPPPPIGCVCFDGGGIEVSVFAAGLVPSGGEGTAADGHHVDDAFGGGLGLGYFFSPNVGIELNYAVLSEDTAVHLVTSNLVLRAPNTNSCFAPYLLLVVVCTLTA